MLSDRDLSRCLEHFREHQRTERERVLCKRGIIRRVRDGARNVRVATPPMDRMKNAEDYIRETFGEDVA